MKPFTTTVHTNEGVQEHEHATEVAARRHAKWLLGQHQQTVLIRDARTGHLIGVELPA